MSWGGSERSTFEQVVHVPENVRPEEAGGQYRWMGFLVRLGSAGVRVGARVIKYGIEYPARGVLSAVLALAGKDAVVKGEYQPGGIGRVAVIKEVRPTDTDHQ